MFRRLNKMSLVRSLGKLLLLTVMLALPVLSPAIASGAEPPKRVLIFYGTDPNLPNVSLINQILRSTLEKGSPVRVQFYSETLDSYRIPENKFESEFVRLLQRKYEGEKFDLIFTISSAAVKFLRKHKDELFLDTPTVFIHTNAHEVDGLDLGPNVTGVHGKIELRAGLELALSLHPGTRRVVVVTGNSGIERLWDALAHEEFRSFENRVKFTYLTNITMEELRAALASLPPQTIVFFVGFMLDSAGNAYSLSESVSLAATSSTAPIYVPIQSGYRQGVVGGRMITHEALGKAAAELGLRILAGARPQDIPQQTVPSVSMFDWRELQRWRIDESRLPAGSLISNRELSVWKLYKWRVIGVITLFILEAFLIVGLLINRTRRRQAQDERQRFGEMAKVGHRRLDEVVSNVPGLVWEVGIDPVSGDRHIQFVSGYIEHMLGYTPEDFLGTTGFGIGLVVEADRERFQREIDEIIAGGTLGVVQFRLLTKAGRVLWVESHLTAIRGEDGKTVGLSGVTMNVSDRRQAEEALKQNQAQLAGIIGSAMDSIISVDERQHVVIFNAAAERMFGCSAAEALGQPLNRFIPTPFGDADRDKDHSVTKQSDDAALYTDSFNFLTGRRASGEYFPIDVSISEVELDGSRFYTIIMRDITERLRAEANLRARKEELSEAQRVAKVGSWELDPETKVVSWSEEMFRIMDRNPELGPPSHEEHKSLYTPSSWERLKAAMEANLHDGTPYEIELEMIRPDGKLVWTSARGEVLRDTHGKIVKLRGTLQDIAERKQAEAALQKAMEEVSQLKNKLEEENIYLREEIKLAHSFDEIVGRSDATKHVLFKIDQVAPTDSTVLITGETGTGKELVAQAIHRSSLRKDRPLVRVNCAALSPTLVESELFGHEKGAFTGATARKIGRFELADDATIFLDEIGELPFELQAKLLRVIQEGEFERLGSSKTIRVDTRIIAATNRNLKIAVEQGLFREDLWYRLNVFPITVPPLRDRKEDIPGLVEHFVTKFSQKVGKQISSISPMSMRAMQNYRWPGNVRELGNVLERAVINTNGTVLRVIDHFDKPQLDELSRSHKTLEEMEKEYIIQTLENTGWRIDGLKGAARILGLNPSTLRTRMSRLGIQKQAQDTAAVPALQ
ncbi:MAG TPA: ABC transporter substrate binding protein [Pyrinomonadaceae bacterium]|nr:ABC transporter substrate binding protein [Pyrinomonadaceae bacterium]